MDTLEPQGQWRRKRTLFLFAIALPLIGCLMAFIVTTCFPGILERLLPRKHVYVGQVLNIQGELVNGEFVADTTFDLPVRGGYFFAVAVEAKPGVSVVLDPPPLSGSLEIRSRRALLHTLRGDYRTGGPMGPSNTGPEGALLGWLHVPQDVPIGAEFQGTITIKVADSSFYQKYATHVTVFLQKTADDPPF